MAKIKIRRDTAANWGAANPVLADGEQGRDTTAKKTKTGDGVTAWNALQFDRVLWDEIVDAPVIPSGDYDDLTNKPVLFTGAYADLTGLPEVFSGSYNDLTDKPVLGGDIDGGNAAG